MPEKSEYREIFNKEIVRKSKSVVFSFDPENDLFYAFGEDSPSAQIQMMAS